MIRNILLLLTSIVVANAADFSVHKLDNAYHLLKTTPDLDWWKTAVFYQIYPRSFMDSNGDGIGDLQGIIQKLHHLQHTGVTAAWLSPIYKSPQVDQGYDISDYRSIDSDYGTMDDFKELLAKAKEMGIKIILDFVPNHTSDQHDWFIKSVNREEGFEDFYVWRDGVIDVNNIRQPPNNWISVFKGSAWEYVQDRDQYYYHAFTVQQPDLNYSNPLVVQAMKDVLTYWMEIGVDGFRFDAVPFLFEDPEFRDSPLAAGKTEYNVNDTSCLDNTYVNHLQSAYDLVYEFRAHIDNYTTYNNTDTKVMMTEAYGTIEQEVRYYGNDTVKGSHFTFNFELISSITNANFTISELILTIDRWLAYLPKQFVSNWVLGNHDQRRVPTRYGKENVDGFNMLTAILPGVMVTYNGEEIGMEDGEVTCEQGYDPQAIKNCTTFSETSRDFERTPYQWDNTTLGGFTTGTPWLPVSNKTKEVNLEAQNVTGISSHYNVYRALMNFRQNFQKESDSDVVSVLKLSDSVLQIFRHVDDDEYSLLFNVGEEEDTVEFFKTKDDYVVVVSSVNSLYDAGASVNEVTLQGHEAIIVQSATSDQSRAQALAVAPCLLLFLLYKLLSV